MGEVTCGTGQHPLSSTCSIHVGRRPGWPSWVSLSHIHPCYWVSNLDWSLCHRSGQLRLRARRGGVLLKFLQSHFLQSRALPSPLPTSSCTCSAATHDNRQSIQKLSNTHGFMHWVHAEAKEDIWWPGLPADIGSSWNKSPPCSTGHTLVKGLKQSRWP